MIDIWACSQRHTMSVGLAPAVASGERCPSAGGQWEWRCLRGAAAVAARDTWAAATSGAVAGRTASHTARSVVAQVFAPSGAAGMAASPPWHPTRLVPVVAAASLRMVAEQRQGLTYCSCSKDCSPRAPAAVTGTAAGCWGPGTHTAASVPSPRGGPARRNGSRQSWHYHAYRGAGVASLLSQSIWTITWRSKSE